MKIIIIKFLNFFCSLFPKKKAIVFESNPDFACNSYEVFLTMLNSNSYKKYCFYWLVKNESFVPFKDARLKLLKSNTKNIFLIFHNYFICNRAEVVISSCTPFDKRKGGNSQLCIYLDHGSQLKNMKVNGQKVYLNVDYVISQSKFFDTYLIDQYTITENQIINTGIPRNDQFYRKTKDLSCIYPDIFCFKKIISWVPTFRTSSHGRIDCSFEFPLGLPLIYSKEDAIRVNEVLKNNNILLIFKPHPALDLTTLNEIHLSNIRFLMNDVMIEKHIQTNEFLLATDAMITDYSGIYYDYLCLDRPIGITLDDFEQYKKEHGFVFENPLDILKGVYIKDVNQLIHFINDVSNDVDTAKNEREKIDNIINDFHDGHSAERVCNFIAKKVGL